MHRVRNVLHVILRSASLAVLLGLAGPAHAHPMGNFSINHYAKITVESKNVEILYLADFAEIPTFQITRELNLTPVNGAPALAAYLRAQAGVIGSRLDLAIDGQNAALQCVARDIEFAEGAGGLPTMKLKLRYRAVLPRFKDSSSHGLTYADHNYESHAGWKEVIVANAAGALILKTSTPVEDRSHELTVYPTDLLSTPPQILSATVTFTVTAPVRRAESKKATPSSSAHPYVRKAPAVSAAPAIAPQAVEQPPSPPVSASRVVNTNTPRNRFTQLITTNSPWTFWTLLWACLIAAGLGALHALEPGHGKTLVAAYLVGSRGTSFHAVVLGVIVTMAHTAGVYALGAITLYGSRYIVPEQLYPWLNAISGIVIGCLGILTLMQRLSGEDASHFHTAGESHAHWFAIKPSRAAMRADSGLQQATGAPVSFRRLVALGITGGMVPCPAALVVLLGAISLHRIGLGLVLITCFSAGLALVLVSVGLLMVRAGQTVSKFSSAQRLQRYLPVLSGSFMMIVGICLIVPAVAGSVHFEFRSVLQGHMVPALSLAGIGLLLGMRHSTDSDHVIAVSTIVTRRGSMRDSAAVGALWGLGHTLTIFLVGTAIILFHVVISPRLGLSMELTVAIMLVLLGVLNLSGLVNRIPARFRPSLPGTSAFPDADAPLGLWTSIRPLLVGLVHGLAGSAAVALLVLSTIKNPLWATAYLIVFGFGTMAGMVTMTIAMSLPLIYTTRRHQRISNLMVSLSGCTSLVFGLFLVYQIGFVHGLFTGNLHWIPE